MTDEGGVLEEEKTGANQENPKEHKEFEEKAILFDRGNTQRVSCFLSGNLFGSLLDFL